MKEFVECNPQLFSQTCKDRFARDLVITKSMKNEVECALINKSMPNKALLEEIKKNRFIDMLQLPRK